MSSSLRQSRKWADRLVIYDERIRLTLRGARVDENVRSCSLSEFSFLTYCRSYIPIMRRSEFRITSLFLEFRHLCFLLLWCEMKKAKSFSKSSIQNATSWSDTLTPPQTPQDPEVGQLKDAGLVLRWEPLRMRKEKMWQQCKEERVMCMQTKRKRLRQQKKKGLVKLDY